MQASIRNRATRCAVLAGDVLKNIETSRMPHDVQSKRSPRQRVFCLVGACGHGNFGDEAVLRAWLRKLGEAFPGSAVHVWGFDAGTISRLHSNWRLELKPSPLLWNLAESFQSRGLLPHEITPGDLFDAERLPTLGDQLARLALFEALRECELVHFIGGGYLNDLWLQPQFALAIVAAALKVFGKPLVLTGQTIGPLGPASIERFGVLLRGANEVELRDRTHCEELRACGCAVREGADDAFLERPAAPASNLQPGRPRCLVCIQNQFLSESEYQALAAKLSQLIVRLHAARPDLEVQALELSPRDGDGVICNALSSALAGRGPKIQLVNFDELWRRADEIFRGDNAVAIGTRFHFALYCARAGMPVVSLVLNDYYAAKHAGLESAFPRRRAVRAQAFDPARDGDFLLEHWPRCAVPAIPATHFSRQKKETFERIYLGGVG